MERPRARNEVLELKDVIVFDYESYGRSSEAGEYAVKNIADMAVDQVDEWFQRVPKPKCEMIHGKKAAREMRDFKIPMQTGNPEGVEFVNMEFMELSGFCREGLGGEKRMIRDGVYKEETGRFED